MKRSATACVPERTLSPVPLASRRPRPSYPLWIPPTLAQRYEPRADNSRETHGFLSFHFVTAFSRMTTRVEAFFSGILPLHTPWRSGTSSLSARQKDAGTCV
jgi:hypothetical protein